MAAELDESYLDFGEFDTKAIIQLQAGCRGWLVRHQIKEVQTEFAQIVRELDSPAVSIEWTETLLPLPTVVKPSKRARSIKATQQGQTFRPEQTPAENETGYNKVSVTDKSSVCPENAQGNAELITRQSLVTRQTHQEVQRDLLQPCNWSKENFNKRDDCRNGDALYVEGSVTTTQTGVQDLTGNLAERNVSGDGEGVRKDLRDRDPSLQVNTVNAELQGQSGGTAVNATQVTSDAADSTTPTVSVTLTPSSGNRSGEKSVSSLHSPALDSWTPTPEPVSESSISKGVAVDSFHGDQTSVWESSSSITEDHNVESRRRQGQAHKGHTSAGQLQPHDATTEMTLRSLSTEELLKQRQNVAMEMLWVQQAIISRKKYLKLRAQMGVAT